LRIPQQFCTRSTTLEVVLAFGDFAGET
jgi:hypothetical protein